MDTTMQDALFFFGGHQAVYPLYERFQEQLLERFPESRRKVQKTRFPTTIGIFMAVCPF